MRRTQPTTKLDVIGHLGLSPEAAVINAADSKRNEDLLKEQPCDPNSGINDRIEILAFKDAEEHTAMLKLQKHMVQNAEQQAIIDANRIDQIKDMYKDLRRRFTETNVFLQKCEKRKNQAEKKVAQEKLLHSKIIKENDKLLEDVEKLQNFRSILTKTVKVLEPYEVVLEEAAVIDPVWISSKDVMQRCDAMMLTQVEVFNMQCEKIIEIEKLRQKMVKMTSDAAIAILGLNTTLQEMERDLLKAQDTCFYWEKILFDIRNCLIKKKDEKARIFWEVDRIYRLLCKCKRVRVGIPDFEVEKRWDYIRNEIRIMKDVLQICEEEKRKREAKAKKAQQSEIERKSIIIESHFAKKKVQIVVDEPK